MSRLRIPGLRWWIIGLVMLGSSINFLTRSTLAVAAPTLLGELNISSQQYSWILAAFQLAIMTQPVCGYVLDVIGLRVGYTVFALAWSVVNMLHGFANGWPVLAGLRALLGFAEGSSNPAGMKATAEWFPAKERGLAGGIYNIGASVGSMLAPPLVAWAVLTYNWRASFWITGALGVAWAVLWAAVYRSPERHPALGADEKRYITAGQEQHLESDGARPPVLGILKQRNFWGIALPRFLADPTWGTLTFWLPLYLHDVRQFDLKQIALFAWMPFLAADVGCVFGGVLSMRLARSGMRLVDARRWSFTLGAILMLGVTGVGYVESPHWAIALLSLGGFAHQTLSVTVITMASDLFKRNQVATVTGMSGTLGNAGVLLFSLLIGARVKEVGYTPFFVGLGLLDLLGAALLWILVRERSSGRTAEQVAELRS
ncbi:MAG TPA: MFS transporter [Polyangiaceae bacterium]|nr:MFS transporter [Polyangiaceae bacterium]